MGTHGLAFVVIRVNADTPEPVYQVYRRDEFGKYTYVLATGAPNEPVDEDTALRRRDEFVRLAAQGKLPRYKTRH